MDPYLIQKVNERTPDFNRSITNGLAVEHMMGKTSERDKMNRTVAYIDRLFLINQELFPEGLEYLGARACTPIEQFEEVTKEYNSRREANVARDDVYMVALHFTYKGEALMPKRILLPFCGDGGLTYLNGALYNISPVLADIGYSVLQGSIFIPFRRTKLTFNSEDYHFYANDTREITYVIWSRIHNEMKKLTNRDVIQRAMINSSLPHYFFANDGVTETFKKWADVEVMVGYTHDFPYSEYSKDKYVRYESIVLKGKHPAGEICLVVAKRDDTDFVRLLVGGFFYVLDTFPGSFGDPSYANSPQLWQTLLGRVIYGDHRYQGRIDQDMVVHLDSVSRYVDEMTRDDLKERGVKADDMWELMYRVMTDLIHHFYQRTNEEASMYGKRLMVLRYVLEELNYAISKFVYNFQTQETKRKGKEWTVDELNRQINTSFKLRTALRKLTSEHGEISTVSYPGDNKFFRITSMLIPQDKAHKKKGQQKGMIADTSRLIHPSLAEIGQFNNQPKTNPSGHGRISQHAKTEIDGMVIQSEKLRPLLNDVGRRLRR